MLMFQLLWEFSVYKHALWTNTNYIIVVLNQGYLWPQSQDKDSDPSWRYLWPIRHTDWRWVFYLMMMLFNKDSVS